MVATALGAAYTLAGRVADAVPLLTQAMEQSHGHTAKVVASLVSRSPGGGTDADRASGGGARPR